jgi:hypothetical protein
MSLSEFHRGWFSEKGIDPQTATDGYGVHSKGDTICFPYGTSIKYRTVNTSETRSFRMDGPIHLFIPTEGITGSTAFLCEGETDTICLAQYIEAPVVGLSGLNGWKPQMAVCFKEVERVFVVLDNDLDYNKADKTWESVRQSLGPRALRIILPDDVKDICEFFERYTPEAFSTLIGDAKEGKNLYHYEALDLTKEPPPYDWLVDDWLAKGDLCMLAGDSGIGKSWITMSLTVAIAEGKGSWLGIPLDTDNRRVYYVDEENPRDVIYHRLAGLGLTESGAANIRYLSDVGIRLDRQSRYILDEAHAWNPSLIVLDSLTRIHSADENNAGEMSRIINDGVRPLARSTGASVIVIHHHNKSGMLRGSSDIMASVDFGISVARMGEHGDLALRQSKSRRTEKSREPLRCRIQDTENGTEVLRLTTGTVHF